MLPKETMDGTNIDPATTVYDNTGGRSPLSCAQLPQTFGKGTWSAYSGQRTSWTNGPAYATKLGTWSTASDIGSSHVCAGDRTCLSEVHGSMKAKLYAFEKSNTTAWPKRTLNRPATYENRPVCDYSKSSRTRLNECSSRTFSQPLAAEYCSKLGMRLCDTNELMFEGETRHCSSQAYFVWTKTPCKNMRDGGNSDVANPNSDTWDPNYFWLVKQYPYYWSEAGDRICAHKDERNQYRFRVNTGTGSTSRMLGVTCCADTSHSPRFTLRYDDDNWSNEEAVWPASDRSFPSDGKRDGWTYRKNPTTATSTDGEWLGLFWTVCCNVCLCFWKLLFELDTAQSMVSLCLCVCFLVLWPFMDVLVLILVLFCLSPFCLAFLPFSFLFFQFLFYHAGTAIAEGTLRLMYHSRFAGPDFQSCQEVYDYCMGEENGHAICAQSNCKFLHGPVRFLFGPQHMFTL